MVPLLPDVLVLEAWQLLPMQLMPAGHDSAMLQLRQPLIPELQVCTRPLRHWVCPAPGQSLMQFEPLVVVEVAPELPLTLPLTPPLTPPLVAPVPDPVVLVRGPGLPQPAANTRPRTIEDERDVNMRKRGSKRDGVQKQDRLRGGMGSMRLRARFCVPSAGGCC